MDRRTTAAGGQRRVAFTAAGAAMLYLAIDVMATTFNWGTARQKGLLFHLAATCLVFVFLWTGLSLVHARERSRTRTWHAIGATLCFCAGAVAHKLLGLWWH